jgi:hypothetical protein
MRKASRVFNKTVGMRVVKIKEGLVELRGDVDPPWRTVVENDWSSAIWLC